MTTFLDLVNQTKSLLRSYTGVQEQVTWLTAACTDTATTLSVNESGVVSMGISEIDEELIFVHTSADNTLTLPPFGRGFEGTTAVAHSTDAMVVYDPAFPAISVKRALNQVLAAMYPRLYQIKTTELTFAGSQATYELPADCDKVLKVTYEMTGPSNYWPMVSRWEFHDSFNEGTTKAITFHHPPEQSSTVHVVYQAALGQFTDNADTLADVGLQESAVDVLLYGACAQLIRFLDSSRLQISSVENMSRAQLVGVGDAGRVANQLFLMHQTRLEEERRKLLELTPAQIYFTR